MKISDKINFKNYFKRNWFLFFLTFIILPSIVVVVWISYDYAYNPSRHGSPAEFLRLKILITALCTAFMFFISCVVLRQWLYFKKIKRIEGNALIIKEKVDIYLSQEDTFYFIDESRFYELLDV